MRNFLYKAIGSISLGLGILGAFLPLLPTTCFILLASWAFAKSSPTIHAWLYYKSPFAKSIQDWQQHRIIPTRVKWIACTSITASYLVTLLLVDNLYILATVGMGLLVLITYLLSKPSSVQTTTYQLIPVLHQLVI